MRMLLAAVVASTVLATAQPAHADVLTAGCTAGAYRLEAKAYYVPAGPWHQWTEFQYRLTGGTGNKSNVNLWVLIDYYATAYFYYSPDSLHNAVTYSHVPPYAVYTDAARVELTEFEAIFDTFLEDPRCPARTQPI